jgi:hypothetical protein
LQWAGYIVRNENTRIPKKYWWSILRKKVCGKTVTELGRQCQEGMLVVAVHKKREEVSTIEHLEAKY